MNTSDLLSNLSFKFSTCFASLQELFSSLTHPKTFTIVLENVSNPQVVFALCLALKQKIRQSNTKTALLSTVNKDKQNQVVLSEHRSLFKSNAMWVQIQKAMQSKANQKKNNSFQTSTPFQIVNQEFYRKDSEVNLWFMQMNYLYLLLESLKSMKNLSNLSQSELHMQLATAKMRDEVISKLIIECLIIQEKLSKMFKISLNAVFLLIEKCLAADQRQVGQRLTNILSEMISYVNKEVPYIRWMRLASKFGREMTNLTFKLFGVFAKAESQVIIENILDIVGQLFNIDRIKNQPLDEKHDNFRKQTQKFIYEDNQILPSYLQSKIYEFISMLHAALVIVLQNQNNISWQSVNKINQILANISLGCSNTCEDPFSKDFKSITQKNQVLIKQILSLFAIIGGKSFNKLQCLEDESQLDFYYEFSFVQKIMKTLYRNMNFTIQENNVLQFMMLNYFPMLIRKIKISFENGGNNPINIMFLYLQRMVVSLQQKNQNQNLQIIHQIRNIFNLFTTKCATAKYNQEFDDFPEENAACYEYFKGMIGLFVELEKYTQKRQELSHFTLLYESIDCILTSQRKTGHYLIRFVLQLIRTNSSINDKSQEILQMMIFLLQRLKLPGFQKQYLIILDIVCDQLIDSQAYEFDQSLSYLWFYLKKNSEETFQQFINKLGAEVVNILVTQKERYFSSYCIQVICRTCKKLGKVEKNRIKNILHQQYCRPNELKPSQKLINYRESLIKRYLFAVYEFFTNLQKSKLNELGHFEKRSQFLEIIGFLGVGTMQDVYMIFNESIVKNMPAYAEESSLYFLTDTIGLMLANSKKIFRIAFIELILATLKLNPHILSRFDLQTLRNSELYFSVFYEFVKAIQYCCRQVKFEHSSVITEFFNSIEPTINLLHTIYSTDNYQQISEIWLAYIEGGSPKSYLPHLPQKLYYTRSTVAKRLLKFYCNNLFRIQQTQQVLIVFRNVFERSTLDWCNYETEMQLNIITQQQKPKILLQLADYVQIYDLDYFFDYQSLIKDIVRSLYSSFVTKISCCSALKQIACDYDDESEEGQLYITHVDEFFISKPYGNGIKELARVHHIMSYVSTGEEFDFQEFQMKFVEELKEMIRQENL